MSSQGIGAPGYEWGDRLPTLTGSRLELRWLGEEDVPALYEIFSDPEVMRYWDSPPLADLTAAGGLLKEIHDHFRARTLFQWGIAPRAGGAVLGTCTLFHWETRHRRAEIGFALGSAHQGKGFAAEAVSTLLAFAFQTLDLHRLEADADPRNEPSLRLLERLGFRREGYLRERYHVNGGEVQDAVMLGLLRPEWEVARRGSVAP
jgi:ribosomal-protein-alanine N-acetyltransferase